MTLKALAIIAPLMVIAATAKPTIGADIPPRLFFHGGVITPGIINVVFWDNQWKGPDIDDRVDYIVNFVNWVNGVNTPLGQEPLLRYYGVWGATIGTIDVDPSPLPATVDPAAFVAEIKRRQQQGWLPPASPENIFVVFAFGDASARYNIGGAAIHDSNNGIIWVGVPWPTGDAWESNTSHELQEAMTDPNPWSGWATNEGFFSTDHNEFSDFCNTTDPSSPAWITSSGTDITGIEQGTKNPVNGNAAQCAILEDQQYSPIGIKSTANSIDVVFVEPAGMVGMQSWSEGLLLWNYTDLGTPGTDVVAVSKPSVVDSSYGTFIFVRGSDQSLWYWHNGVWTSTGEIMLGDPSAGVWNNGSGVNVFVLGAHQIVVDLGWNGASFVRQEVNPAQHISGPPKAISRHPWAIDVFAVGTNMRLEQTSWSIFLGKFSSYLDLGSIYGSPHFVPPGVTSWGADRLDIFVGSEYFYYHRGWEGSWASNYDFRPEMHAAPNADRRGTPAVVSWGSGRIDVVIIDTSGNLVHSWYDRSIKQWASKGEVIATDAVGDPVMVSRGTRLLDIFYKRSDGTLMQVAFRGDAASRPPFPSPWIGPNPLLSSAPPGSGLVR